MHKGNLLFRRQFVLADRPITPASGWDQSELPCGLVLSVHPDLERTFHQQGTRLFAVLGLFFDPLRPNLTTRELLEDIACNTDTFDSVLNATDTISGRWVLICCDRQECRIFHDPCGLRQVYFTGGNSACVCASQPELLAAHYPLSANEDKALHNFVNSLAFAVSENNWIGKMTVYKDVYRLLPNHYLDARKGLQQRYYPARPLSRKTVEEAVTIASLVLRGTFEALAPKRPLTLAVTAGWDSRVLLAAARPYLDTIECYVDRIGVYPESHPDVVIPTALSRRLGFDFKVRNSHLVPSAEFVDLLRSNVTGARVLAKTRAIYSKFAATDDRLNVNGNGSEICRRFFERHLSVSRLSGSATPQRLSSLCGFHKSSFVEQELGHWLLNARFEDNNIRAIDMLYWEHRMGTWGAQFPAEQDIACDEVSPFNNRLLLNALLATPLKDRTKPNYPLYQKLIHSLWPEALSLPINPRPLPLRLLGAVRDCLPLGLQDSLGRAFRR